MTSRPAIALLRTCAGQPSDRLAHPKSEYFNVPLMRSRPLRRGVRSLHPGEPRPVDPPWLLDLDQDPGEQYDIAAERPDVVRELRRMTDEHRRGVRPVEDQIAKR